MTTGSHPGEPPASQLTLEISSVHVPERQDHAIGARVRPPIVSNVEQDYEVSFDSGQTAMLLV